MEEEIKEYIPETIPEFELSNDVTPWLSEDKLDAGISIRWLSNKVYTTTAAYTTISWSVFTLTWVPFRPKHVQIIAIRNPAFVDNLQSIVDIVETSPWVFSYSWVQTQQTNTKAIFNNLAVKVSEQAWTPASNATMTSFNSDWFTLTFSSPSWNVDMKIVCYW